MQEREQVSDLLDRRLRGLQLAVVVRGYERRALRPVAVQCLHAGIASWRQSRTIPYVAPPQAVRSYHAATRKQPHPRLYQNAHRGIHAMAITCRRAGSSPSNEPDSIEDAVSAMKWPCSAGNTAVPILNAALLTAGCSACAAGPTGSGAHRFLSSADPAGPRPLQPARMHGASAGSIKMLSMRRSWGWQASKATPAALRAWDSWAQVATEIVHR